MKRENGWRIVLEEDDKYAYKGDQWVSIEDEATVRAKANYVRENRFFGVALYSLEHDDVSNMCGDGSYPLLNTVRDALTQTKWEDDEDDEYDDVDEE